MVVVVAPILDGIADHAAASHVTNGAMDPVAMAAELKHGSLEAALRGVIARLPGTSVDNSKPTEGQG